MTTTGGGVRYGRTVLELKTVDADRWRFTGYASVFGVTDFGNDKVASGAFRDTLARRKAPLPLLWGHDQREPIGHAVTLAEDAKGLRGEWQVVDTARGSDAYRLLKAGSLSGLSIGYVATDTDVERGTGTRLLKAIDLLEVSLVPVPMLDVARIDTVKGAGSRRARELLARLDALGGQRSAGLVEAYLDRRAVADADAARRTRLETLRARLRRRGLAV